MPSKPHVALDSAHRLPRLYNAYSLAEESVRINSHYDHNPEFFRLVTGGEWNTYSCNIWPARESGELDLGSKSVTESQAGKLDWFARIANLKAGMRVLDVGCGWGGPLVYLSKQYGVKGVGLTLSPEQRQFAEARARKYNVPSTFIVCNWREFADTHSFDLILTDEVLVHITDLAGFFAKARSLLKPHGRMLNKELHLANPVYKDITERGASLISQIFGDTGNYRTLSEELELTCQAGFNICHVETIPQRHYEATIRAWLSNFESNRAVLSSLVGREFSSRFHRYLKLARAFACSPAITADVVVAAPRPTTRQPRVRRGSYR